MISINIFMKITEIITESQKNNTEQISSDDIINIVETADAGDWDSMSGEEYLKRLQQGTLSWQQ